MILWYDTRFDTAYYVIFKKLYDSEALGGGRKGGTNTACALQLEYLYSNPIKIKSNLEWEIFLPTSQINSS